jgi:protein-S-isoprenylcysteine O-methyltransferase Ste14
MGKPSAALGSALFFIAAPGTVAGLIPWWLTDWQYAQPLAANVAWLMVPVRIVGGLLVVIAVAVLVAAFARFVTEGVGTPAPMAPTERLVVGGLYRYVRNPMYLAVVAAIVGQGLLLGQVVLVAYAALAWLAMAAFVLGYEEPTLLERFGNQYERYRAAVPAWWPRLRPWDDDGGSRHG